MEPIDIILACIPKLSPKEKDQVRSALGQETQSACERGGHKYPAKPIEVMTSIFSPTKKIFVCSKCGHKLEM